MSGHWISVGDEQVRFFDRPMKAAEGPPGENDQTAATVAKLGFLRAKPVGDLSYERDVQRAADADAEFKRRLAEYKMAHSAHVKSGAQGDLMGAIKAKMQVENAHAELSNAHNRVMQHHIRAMQDAANEQALSRKKSVPEIAY